MDVIDEEIDLNKYNVKKTKCEDGLIITEVSPKLSSEEFIIRKTGVQSEINNILCKYMDIVFS